MVAKALTLLLVIGTLTAAPVPAVAHDHEPPRVVMRGGGAFQRGLLGTYCWVSFQPPFYVQECSDNVYRWPKAERARVRSRAHILIRKSQPPEELNLAYWSDVNADGNPRGRATEVRFDLEPVIGEDIVAWKASFRLPRKAGHYYLEGFGVWADATGGDRQQDATWTFHLRLRKRRS